MNKQQLIQNIVNGIYQNTEERITGQILQDILILLVNAIYSQDIVSRIEYHDDKLVVHYSDSVEQEIPLPTNLPDNTIANFDIGSISKGDDISNVSLQEIIERILMGYTYPIVDEFYISRKGNVPYTSTNPYLLEIGENININDRISWSYDNTYYQQSSTVLKDMHRDIILLQNTNSKMFQVNSSIPGLSIPGKYEYRIILSDLNGNAHEYKKYLEYHVRMYFGSSTNATLSAIAIRNTLSSSLSFKQGNEYVMEDEGYKYFIIPSILDTQNWYVTNKQTGFYVPLIKRDEISITNDFGITLPYNVYRTEFIIDETIKVILNEQ